MNDTAAGTRASRMRVCVCVYMQIRLVFMDSVFLQVPCFYRHELVASEKVSSCGDPCGMVTHDPFPSAFPSASHNFRVPRD